MGSRSRIITLPKEYPYLYETHLHTREASACAADTGAAMAKACKEAGYTGIFVTNHNWGGNTAVGAAYGRKMSWQEWVEGFSEGYENAKRMGDEIGLDVFFAWEAGYMGTEFLIYGLTKEWLLDHPEMRTADVEEQFMLVKEGGGMVIHAHPYREEFYIPEIRLYPEWVDGVEGINATHSNPGTTAHGNRAFDERAVAYGNKHNLPLTAGSDIHTVRLLGGGMAFKRRLESPADFIHAVKSGEDYLLTNGAEWFDKNGNKIII